MLNSLIIILLSVVFILILLGVAWSSKRLAEFTSEKEYVQCVEAGGINEATADELSSLSFTDVKRSYRDDQGMLIDRNRFKRIVVHNNCMRPRRIWDKDQLLVRTMVNPSIAQLKSGDILFLKIQKDGKDYYKIRELDSVIPEKGELVTHYYDTDGTKHPSSKNHMIGMVQGVVKYNLSR